MQQATNSHLRARGTQGPTKGSAGLCTTLSRSVLWRAKWRTWLADRRESRELQTALQQFSQARAGLSFHGESISQNWTAPSGATRFNEVAGLILKGAPSGFFQAFEQAKTKARALAQTRQWLIPEQQLAQDNWPSVQWNPVLKESNRNTVRTLAQSVFSQDHAAQLERHAQHLLVHRASGLVRFSRRWAGLGTGLGLLLAAGSLYLFPHSAAWVQVGLVGAGLLSSLGIARLGTTDTRDRAAPANDVPFVDMAALRAQFFQGNPYGYQVMDPVASTNFVKAANHHFGAALSRYLDVSSQARDQQIRLENERARHLIGGMKAPPAIIIIGALLAMVLGFMAWQEPGQQPAEPDRPAGYRTGSPGEKP